MPRADRFSGEIRLAGYVAAPLLHYAGQAAL